MQVGHFPASAATSLIQGYCDDFVSLATILAQTLEQVSMRGIGLEHSRPPLQRIEKGMRELAEAIRELLDRGQTTADAAPASGKEGKAKDAAPARQQPAPAVNAAANPVPGHASGQAPTHATGHSASHSSSHAPSHAAGHSPGHPTGHPNGASTVPSPASSIGQSTNHAAVHPPIAAMSTATPQPHPHAPAHPPAPAPQRAPVARPAAAAPASPPAPAARPAAAAAPTAMAPRAATTAHAPPPRGTPTRPAPRAEALRGTSQSMPLLSVFQFLGRMRKAGTMRVRVAGENLVFELQNGCVLTATSDRCPPDELLGELLVEHAACTKEQLAPIVAKVDGGATERFGQLAIQAGLVKIEQVLGVLEVQARRRFTRACKASDAAYEFVEESRPATEPIFRIPPMPIS